MQTVTAIHNNSLFTVFGKHNEAPAGLTWKFPTWLPQTRTKGDMAVYSESAAGLAVTRH